MIGGILTLVATAIALCGTVLNCKKIMACFCLWAVANAMWFGWDVRSGLWPRAILDAVQFGLAIYGIYEWRKPDVD